MDALADALRRRPASPPPSPARPRARPLAPLALAGALLLALGGVAAALVTRGDGDPTRASAPQLETVTQQVTVARQPTTVVQTITAAPPEAPAPSGPLDVEEAAALNDQAYALMQEGRWQDALLLLERAVPVLRGTYSDDFRYEAYAEYNLGRTQAELGECKEARKHLKRSEHLQGGREELDEALSALRQAWEGLSQALGVLTAVVVQVLAGLDRLPPGPVRPVPLDRLREALLERLPRLPAQRAELRRVERVAAVVPGRSVTWRTSAGSAPVSSTIRCVISRFSRSLPPPTL